MLGLRWEDVDLPRRQLHVRRALSQLPDRVQLKRPKTSRTRTISIDEATADALAQRRQRQDLVRR